MIETRQARYFVAVAQELHFGHAADLLQMSQPPLSQAIRALEEQLGVRLLDRTTRSVALTDAGVAFLHQCRVLLADAERAEDAARRAEQGLSGTVRLGAITTAYKDPLPTLLREFRAGHPDVVIQATEIDTHEGRPGVLDGRLDVALVRQVPSDKALQTLALRRDHLVAAVPASHPLAAAHDLPLDLSEARDERWVWLPRRISPDYHDELVAACRRYGFSPIATHMATSIDSQLAMVGCGLGITVIPHTATVGAPDGVVVRPLTKRCELVALSLLWRRDESDPLTLELVESARRSIRTADRD